MNADLLDMWAAINEAHFESGLVRVADIEWLPLSCEQGIWALAVYFPKSNAMAIDERFRMDRAAIRAGDRAQTARFEVAYRLVIHEMVHQAQYQRKLPQPGDHGASFIELATPIAQRLGIRPPNEATARRWPEIDPLLLRT